MSAVAEARLADIDLTDLDRWVEGVPHDWFAVLRREAPVFWQDERRGRGFWSLTRYDDVLAASKDYETFSSETGGTSLMDLTPEQIESRKSMLDSDPPRHTRLRNIVNKAFIPRAVNAYEGRIHTLFRDVLEEAFASREFDFVDAVAVELPMRILCELMGVPLDDRRYLVDLGNRMLGNTDPDTAGEEYVADRADLSRYAHLPFSSPAAPEMFAYANRLAAERRKEPRDDLTTRLVEPTSTATSSPSTSSTSSSSCSSRPATRRRATRCRTACSPCSSIRPSGSGCSPTRRCIPTAVEEILRWAPSLLHFRRTVTRDVELHGQRLRAGDKVALWYVSGNHDEAQFPDASRFDVGRQPNKHLAFGLGGPHFCLGAHLARLELRIWLEEMLPTLGRIELAGPPARLRSNFFHGVKSVPIRLR